MAAEESRVDGTPAVADPPEWAQEVLLFLVREDRAENIAGDLLEEYRDVVLPARGRREATRWYVRQVAGFLWRLSRVFGVLVALQWIGNGVANAIVSPDNHQLRSALMPFAPVWVYLIASAYGGWRTQRMVGGALTAIAAHVIGCTIAVAVGIVLHVTVISHDATMVHQFQATGDWQELFGMPVVVTPVVMALGVVGGFFGQFVAWKRNAKTIDRTGSTR
jgi:hypothetical protein